VQNTPQNTPQPQIHAVVDAASLMRMATLLSLSAGIFLVILKGIAWSFTDSLSLMSSLADSLLDVMASAINFVAVRYALQPPDEEHRFGHGKAEDLASFAQSTFICGSGLFLVVEGIKRFFSPEPVKHSMLGIGVMLISIIVTLSLVIYQRRVVRLTGSQVVKSDALHYYADLLTNAAVIAAFILSYGLGWYEADALFAVLIAGYLIITSASLGCHAFQNLMDHEFLPDDRAKIEQIVRGSAGVLGMHDLRTRKSGLNGFIQLHLDLDPEMPLRQAHIISDAVEAALAKTFPNTEILIHQDPLHENNQ
jgi:ferrous-iron efflux pump FieF